MHRGHCPQARGSVAFRERICFVSASGSRYRPICTIPFCTSVVSSDLRCLLVVPRMMLGCCDAFSCSSIGSMPLRNCSTKGAF
eukprot:4105086-Pleurochrysis_carterae.AAC.1